MQLDLFYLVSNLGFTAIVTMCLLIRIEAKLENLSTSINLLSNIYMNRIIINKKCIY